jgi:hypothetical protein
LPHALPDTAPPHLVEYQNDPGTDLQYSNQSGHAATIKLD